MEVEIQHNDALTQALREWKSVLDPSCIRMGADVQKNYGADTANMRRNILAALVPFSQSDVVSIVKIANKYQIPLYPISKGNNWGYGSANPVKNNSAIVDLSRMNRIVSFDKDAGVVTVEPGVDQEQLSKFLDENHLDYLVPVHGGGPTCSLIGNALERGYGITPHTDHFSAMMSIKAVLADGSLYQSAHAQMGEETTDKIFKWGIGPYLDGIFSQSNFGIVTEMSIALAPRPEKIEVFFFAIKKDEDVEEAVATVQSILKTVGMTTGSINLLNPDRILAMMGTHTEKDRAKLPAWTGVGAIYGPKGLVKETKKIIKAKLSTCAEKIVFVSKPKLTFLKRLLALLPLSKEGFLHRFVKTAGLTLDMLNGIPTEVALPLAYTKSGVFPRLGQKLNPAKDGCGIIWYSPLVPMRGELVRKYLTMVKTICKRHNIDPLITMTTLSDRCIDSTVPLLFDRENPSAVQAAKACFEQLLMTGIKEGFYPYRLSIDAMKKVVRRDHDFWAMGDKIKKAIDPNNILSPGRYSL